MDLNLELKRIKRYDLETNKKELIRWKSIIDKNYTRELEDNQKYFIEYLYKPIVNSDAEEDKKRWTFSQLQSIHNQISKIIDPDSKFMEYYKHILKDEDIIFLTKEIIYDAYGIPILRKKLELDGSISRGGDLWATDFFTNAKFAYFSQKFSPTLSRDDRQNFTSLLLPTIIRQAIEIRIREMIGLEKITDSNQKFKLIPISKILEDLKDMKAIDFSIDTLIFINKWTNAFVHTGEVPHVWQSLEAIDLIEPFFATKKDEGFDLQGVSLIKENISCYQIKKHLETKNQNTIFHLWDENTEKIYRILEKYEKNSSHTVKIEEWLQEFNIPHTDNNIKYFEQNILYPAEQQINKKTDLYFTYKQLRENKIIYLEFKIEI